MAGQLAELSHRTLKRDFRKINTCGARVILLDAASQVLPPVGKEIGEKAMRDLEDLGVEVQLGVMVVDVDERGVEVEDGDGTRRHIEAVTKVCAAGVEASPLGKMLAEQTGAPLDRAGLGVNPDLTLPGHPEVFVVGDMIVLHNLPEVAQVAIQTSKYAAKEIKNRLAGKPAQGPFKYRSSPAPPLNRLQNGASDLVSRPERYDAAREHGETNRRAELAAKAAQESRLTDMGERGTRKASNTAA